MHDGNVWLEVYRWLTSLLAWVVLFLMEKWLRAFHKGLYKRRHELMPQLRYSPLKWWFVLFCGLGLLILAVALGNMYSAYRNFPFNPISLLVMPGEITIFVGLVMTYDFVRSQIKKGDSDE